MLDSKGYNEKVPLICLQKEVFPLDVDESEDLNAGHDDQSGALTASTKICGGTFLYESIITELHPWILCVYISNLKPGHTGVDLLSSLRQNIQIRGVHYQLGAVMFADENHFYSLAVDPISQGDLNIFYNGIKGGYPHTTLVPFKGSFKEVVGHGYDITAIFGMSDRRDLHT